MAKLVIVPIPHNEYRFKLVSDDGETIIFSERYSNQVAASRATNSFKVNAAIRKQFVKLTSSQGEPYFILRLNRIRLATSKMYKSKAERDRAIAAVKKYAPDAILENEYQ